MGRYKRIEQLIAEYISERYHFPVEIGIGRNHVAAALLAGQGIPVRATDRYAVPVPDGVRFRVDDLYSPDAAWYEGADLIYAIRPGVEMVPALIVLARQTGADLVVYHLGGEVYRDGGELVDCGIVLHRYVRAQKPSKRVD